MKKKEYSHYFHNKKILILDISEPQKNLVDIIFIAKLGASLSLSFGDECSLTKKEGRRLKGFKNINYIEKEDISKILPEQDYIIHGGGYNTNNAHLEEAILLNIPCFSFLTLLLWIQQKELPLVQTIGIGGTKGKSTTQRLIEHILDSAEKKYVSYHNVPFAEKLSLLKKLEENTLLILELESYDISYFQHISYSPNISVFTNLFEDELDYYKGSMKNYFKDISHLFSYQKNTDILVLGHSSYKALKKFYKKDISSHKIVARFKDIPKTWSLKSQHKGRHTERNMSQGFQVAKILGIEKEIVKKSLLSFQGIEGRFQYLGNLENGIMVFNDSHSSTPESTISSLVSLKRDYPESNIILLSGGMDKGFHYQKMAKCIMQHVYFSVLLSGQMADKLKVCFPKEFNCYTGALNLSTALKVGYEEASENSIIIFSPGAAAGDIFKNEEERNKAFLSAFKKIKNTLS
jgi:UDP-N-acetylmuramoylalanine--D-glutamate ligase